MHAVINRFLPATVFPAIRVYVAGFNKNAAC